jgi:hypothetical protein
VVYGLKKEGRVEVLGREIGKIREWGVGSGRKPPPMKTSADAWLSGLV